MFETLACEIPSPSATSATRAYPFVSISPWMISR